MSTVTAQNLFAGSAAGKKKASAPKSKYAVEFKAGKMNKVGTTVTADPRKGTVYMTRSDDSLLHFCWKDRKTGAVEDDLIIFPDEAEWLAVPQCTTGRVFVLKFKTSAQRLFYWMQESFPAAADATAADQANAKKINEYINNPAAMVVPGAGAAGADSADAGDDDGGDIDMNDSELSQLLSGAGLTEQQQQLMQMLAANGMMGQRAGAAVAAARSRSSSPQRAAPTTTGAAAATPAANATRLVSVLTPELLAPVLADSTLRAQLLPLVPEGQTPQEVIASPQFQQAVQSLDSALQSGELGPLLAELGIDASVARANNDRVLALLRAIQQKKSSGAGAPPAGDAMDES